MGMALVMVGDDVPQALRLLNEGADKARYVKKANKDIEDLLAA
jgi:hypothetical protein